MAYNEGCFSMFDWWPILEAWLIKKGSDDAHSWGQIFMIIMVVAGLAFFVFLIFLLGKSSS